MSPRSSSRTGTRWRREPLTGVFNNPTKAFPNLLESILIRGNIAYVAGTCSSPNGPFRFNVNVQSCVSTIDTTQDVEIKTVNMNDGVNFEVPGETRLFNTNPFALAFKRSAAEGFVAVAATNRLLRVSLDGQGIPTINAPAAPLTPGAASPIIRIQLRDPNDPADVDDPQDLFGGKNPRGLVINSADTRAYVMDFLSRDVAVVDISAPIRPSTGPCSGLRRRACRGRAPRTRSFSAASTSSTPPSGRSARPTTPVAPRG